MLSVAYSPDGRHIISGSFDRTIRVWDAVTGAPVSNPPVGHNHLEQSVASSPDGRHIVPESNGSNIRIWGAEADTAAGKSLGGRTYSAQSIAYSSDGKHIVSKSYDNTTRALDTFPRASIRPSSCSPMHPNFCTKPDKDGWVKDSEGGLLYWVPHDCRESVHSPALMTIPLTSRHRSVALDFDDFAFGTSWSQIFNRAHI